MILKLLFLRKLLGHIRVSEDIVELDISKAIQNLLMFIGVPSLSPALWIFVEFIARSRDNHVYL